MTDLNGLNTFFFTDLLLSEGKANYKTGGNGVFNPVPAHAEKAAASLYKLCCDNTAPDSRIEYSGVKYRCSRKQTVGGLVFALRRPMAELPEISKLGYQRSLIQRLTSNEPPPFGIQNGLVIFAGVTCSGKTHSACALIRERLIKHGGLAVTIEDPPELPLQGVYGENDHGRCYQCDFIEEMGGVAAVGASILRFGAPNIVMYGEIRDGQSAAEAMRAALSGHLIILTIHASGIKEALERLLGYATEIIGTEAAALQLATALTCVIHQRLVVGPETGKENDKEKLQLYADFLFTNVGVKGKIRAGQLHMLDADVEQQRNLMLHQPREKAKP